VKVKELTYETAEWDRYVRQMCDASVYHLSVWKQLIENVFGHKTYYLYALDSEEHICGILPLVQLKSYLFGNYIVSLPFFNYGGMVVSDMQAEGVLTEYAISMAKRLGVSHIELRETLIRSENWKVRKDKVSMLLELPEKPEILWSSIGSKLRAQIKRPQREGVETTVGGVELVDDFYAVFSRNMRDLGTPVYSRKFFHTIASELSEESNLVVVKHKGTPVAAGFIVGYRDTAEIPWASSLRKYNSIGVNMQLYWDVLKLSIDKGYKTFDFGRSSEGSGTYRFKKQWGAKPRQLHWHYWLKDNGDIPILNPTNPKYKIAIEMWKKMPVSIANWLGPKIVKNLP